MRRSGNKTGPTDVSLCAIMYNTFFGFIEKPFKLVPNPAYLYLSKSHEVALAHLTYATNQGDGFVVITGEVGTGKTTLCRIFLERLDDQTESAYIFNPKLDSVELLVSICNEFGVVTPAQTVKELLDVINKYLIKKNETGRKIILLIDEAQNLTVEGLEMVRMLSNLETTRHKLLQIILVGQPELGDKLDSHELRQLSQRISLSCHLTPLTARETEGYIQHRVRIAAQRDHDVFTPGACRRVYRYANGIPRLINIACDRALLTAYSLDRQKVKSTIAQAAIRELNSKGGAHTGTGRRWQRAVLWGAAGLFILLIAALIVMNNKWLTSQWFSNIASRKPKPAASAYQPPPLSASKPVQAFKVPNDIEPVSAEANEPTVPVQYNFPLVDTPPAIAPQSEAAAVENPTASPDATPEAPSAAELASRTGAMDAVQSRMDALGALLASWGQPRPNKAQLPAISDDPRFFEIAARQYGLRVYAVEENWTLVRRLNMPAIVVLKKQEPSQTVYMTMTAWDNKHIRLSDGHSPETIDIRMETLQPFLQGTAYVFWKNILGFDAIIAQGANQEAISAVKALLYRIGYEQVVSEAAYDHTTRQAIIDFQVRNQLNGDGLVGPLTKIFLINAASAYDVPRLAPRKGTGA